MALPKRVTQNRSQSILPASGGFFLTVKGATEERVDTEHIEKFRRDALAAQALRFTRDRECKRRAAIERKAGEGFVLGAEIGEIRETDRIETGVGARVALVERADGDELLRLWKRQRLKQDGVDNAKDRGVRPNAEGKGENGDDGEAGRFRQLAESETQLGHAMGGVLNAKPWPRAWAGY